MTSSIVSQLFTRMAGNRTSTLSDVHESSNQHEISGRLDDLDQQLEEAGITGDDCIAVESGSSVGGALLVLLMLRRNQGFVLTPPTHGDQQEAWKPTPAFCSHRIRLPDTAGARTEQGQRAALAEATMSTPRKPVPALHIEPNPRFRPASRSSTRGKLFLRTSGSMGEAKLVVHAHEKLLLNAEGCTRHYQYSERDRMIIPLPIAHMYGLGAGLLPALLAGASVDLLEGANLIRFLDRERLFEPSVALLTPTLCDMLRDGYRSRRTSYRLVITSGQRISSTSFRVFDAIVSGCLVNQYGSTELGAIAASHPRESLEVRADTVGTPMPGVLLSIDPEGDADRDGGDYQGELTCIHPYGFLGYVDERGEWLFLRDAADPHRTGDRAQVLAGGAFQLQGRIGNSLNRRGYLVHLGEIEQLLEQSGTLEQVVVVVDPGRSSSTGGHEGALVAFCVPRVGGSVTEDTVSRMCQQLLPPYAIPDRIVVLPAMPHLPNTKVDRQALAALAMSSAGA